MWPTYPEFRLSYRMDAAELFRQHLSVISQAAAAICRRNGVANQDAEDFESEVRLKLCENDYAIVRKFQGKSSFATFLNVVITKSFVDHQRRLWGKWNPSSQARRLGDIAVQLEALIYRDGRTFDSSRQILEQRHGSAAGSEALRKMFAKLPRRSRRRFEGSDGLDFVASHDDAESSVSASERDGQLASASGALQRALQDLPDEDRLIIRMIYYEGLSVADIARGLHLEQPRLYPRIRHILASLRNTLASQGISPDFLQDVGPD
jgi:RNA polymerase sigma factor for flagellar operon FliA